MPLTDLKAMLDPATNQVTNIVLVDPEQVPAFLASFPWATPDVTVGAFFDPETGTFAAPTPEPMPPDPQPDPEALLDLFTRAIDAHVEAVARTRRYNGAAHMASYVASTVPVWAAEAQAFVAWRDSVWTYALSELAAIQTGAKPIPTVDDLLNALPAPVWPE